jgi:hypothetical protein
MPTIAARNDGGGVDTGNKGVKTVTLGFILLALFMVLLYYVGFGQDVGAMTGATINVGYWLTARSISLGAPNSVPPGYKGYTPYTPHTQPPATQPNPPSPSGPPDQAPPNDGFNPISALLWCGRYKSTNRLPSGFDCGECGGATDFWCSTGHTQGTGPSLSNRPEILSVGHGVYPRI